MAAACFAQLCGLHVACRGGCRILGAHIQAATAHLLPEMLPPEIVKAESSEVIPPPMSLTQLSTSTFFIVSLGGGVSHLGAV